MSLYWPEARLAVSCAGSNAPREELPEDVLVIHVSPEEARDPSFAEEISYLLCERLEEWRGELEDEIRERGKGVLKPQREQRDSEEEHEPTEEEEAESRLMELIEEEMGSLTTKHGDENLEEEMREAEDIWSGLGDPLGDETTLLGDPLSYTRGLLGTAGINIVINHCDELFVRR